tara:strand:- start:54126 stop:55172 length:1047 start_codon:yes stop_codon:yes gene_type:complete
LNHRVTFQPAGFSIECRADQTILEAAREQGVNIRAACANGVCEVCRAERVSGEFLVTKAPARAVLESRNQVLCCATYPQSDIEIYMKDVIAPGQKPSQTLACQVLSTELLTDDVWRIILRAPAGKSPDYWAGQYLLLHLGSGTKAEQLPYSIANAPGALTGQDARDIELHISANSDKAREVVRYLQGESLVRVTLPAGECIINDEFLRQSAGQPLLFVAGGSGFSQIKALIEATLALEPQREIHLYWSNRAHVAFYLPDLPFSWADAHPNFHYHPVIYKHEPGWNGRAGWLHTVISEDFARLDGVQMFACGSPAMVFGTLDQLEPSGLSVSNMHSDVFAWAKREDFTG